MRLAELERANRQALERRPFTDPSYRFRPVSPHDGALHELRSTYPFHGYVEVEVEHVRPFVMFSNNDDLVAQTYFWFGPDSYETTSMRIWRRLVRLHGVVVDIGSFTGVYSLVAATANPDAVIVSIEPMREVFRRLVDNLAVNRLAGRVRTVRRALGDRGGEATLFDFRGPRTLSTGSSLIEKPGKPVIDEERVVVERYDTLVADGEVPVPDIVKIDVEQAEVAVIRGMTEVIAEHRPKLIVEVTGQGNLVRLMELLHPRGYNFAVIDDLGSTVVINDMQRVGDGVANVFFVAARPEQIRSFCLPLATTSIA